jgi:hypothetical protein
MGKSLYGDSHGLCVDIRAMETEKFPYVAISGKSLEGGLRGLVEPV